MTQKDKIADLVHGKGQLSPRSTVVLEKLTVTKSPTYYGTRRFITVLTTVRHWSISWARLIQPT